MPTPESRPKKSSSVPSSRKSDDAPEPRERRERRGPVTLVSNCTRQVHLIVRKFDANKQPVMNDEGKQETYKLVIGSTLDADVRDRQVPKPTLVIQRNDWLALKRDKRAIASLRGRQKAKQLMIIGD